MKPSHWGLVALVAATFILIVVDQGLAGALLVLLVGAGVVLVAAFLISLFAALDDAWARRKDKEHHDN